MTPVATVRVGSTVLMIMTHQELKIFHVSWLNDNVKVNILKTVKGSKKIFDVGCEPLTLISILRSNSRC